MSTKVKRPAGGNGEALRHNAKSGKTNGAEATSPKNLAQQVREPTGRMNIACCWRAHYRNDELIGSVRQSPFGGYQARDRQQRPVGDGFYSWAAAAAAIERGRP
jgi:hypothetical protein